MGTTKRGHYLKHKKNLDQMKQNGISELSVWYLKNALECVRIGGNAGHFRLILIDRVKYDPSVDAQKIIEYFDNSTSETHTQIA